MAINTSLDNLIVVELPQDLGEHGNELQTAIDMVLHAGDCDVVVDFSDTDIVGSLTFSRLLELRTLLHGAGLRLVLCGVSPAVKGVFAVAQLDGLFDFAKDVPAALARLQGFA